MNCALFFLNSISAFSALLAGALWLKSTMIKVEHVDRVSDSGWIDAAITVESKDGKQIDPFATASSQNLWNRRAAAAACVAALSQGIAAGIQAFTVFIR